MKITDKGLNPTGIDNAKNLTRPADKGDKAKEKPSASPSASVEISDATRMMRQALQVAHEAPSERVDKVSALKELIRDGKYHVDADKIADKLVDEHLNSDFGKNSL